MKKIDFLILQFILLIGFNGLKAQNNNCPPDANDTSFDVILVAGQSNTHYGLSLDTKIDTVNSRVYTLRRSGGKDYQIEPATAVLDFWTRQTNRNSFAITFSNLYVENILKNNNRKVLIIPAGYAGSSIVSWTKGQNLYEDAIARVNYVINNIPGSKLVAILWHQGEANIGWQPYQTNLDKMISDMRADINQANSNNIPFILGGMVPHWVNLVNNRKIQQQIIKETPLRVANTGYADPEYPTIITKPNNNYDDIHFDAAGQREMGKRYFEIYQNIILHTNLLQTKGITNSINVDVINSNESPSQDLEIFPNPVNETLNIESPYIINKIDIYDLYQNKVFTNTYTEKKVMLNVNNLEKGNYVVVVTFENGKNYNAKIIKN